MDGNTPAAAESHAPDIIKTRLSIASVSVKSGVSWRHAIVMHHV
jgi:hypothetical protein